MSLPLELKKAEFCNNENHYMGQGHDATNVGDCELIIKVDAVTSYLEKKRKELKARAKCRINSGCTCRGTLSLEDVVAVFGGEKKEILCYRKGCTAIRSTGALCNKHIRELIELRKGGEKK